MIEVALADDHPVVLDGIERFITRSGDIQIVGVAGTAEEMWRLIAEQRPNVLVLDLNMPGVHGRRTVAQLREEAPDVGVVVFSMVEEGQFALDLIRAGVSAFVNKSRGLRELTEAIRRAHSGARYLTAELADRTLQLGGSGGHQRHDVLSARERQVFDLLAQCKKPQEVASEMGLTSSTVHTYTERIKAKLGLRTLQDIVGYAFRSGLTK